ncbi:hypothetical protein HMPREF1544_03451, partial [Mucor circinelloides 1006PhL]
QNVSDYEPEEEEEDEEEEDMEEEEEETEEEEEKDNGIEDDDDNNNNYSNIQLWIITYTLHLYTSRQVGPYPLVPTTLNPKV